MKTRQQANQDILFLLTKAMEKYPDLRFGQILHTFRVLDMEEHDTPDGVFHTIKDPFYEESTVTLNRILGIK
jgi:hypothetical protein